MLAQGLPMTDDAALHDIRVAVEHIRERGFAAVTWQPAPALLAALGLPEATDLPDARSAVRSSLISCAAVLRPELRTAFLVAAGAHQGAPASSSERMQQLTAELHVSLRTAYRKVKNAISEIAALLVERAHVPMVEGAHIIMTRSICRVDLRGKSPTVLMQRTIRAYVDGISYFDEQFQLPRYDGEKLHYKGLEGCLPVQVTHVGNRLWAARLQFPAPLRIGHEHTFVVRLRLPRHEDLEPMMGFVPHTSSFHATVELYFGQQLPAFVESFEAMPPTGRAPEVGTNRREQQLAAQLCYDFPKMQPGLSYGVRWG